MQCNAILMKGTSLVRIDPCLSLCIGPDQQLHFADTCIQNSFSYSVVPHNQQLYRSKFGLKALNHIFIYSGHYKKYLDDFSQISLPGIVNSKHHKHSFLLLTQKHILQTQRTLHSTIPVQQTESTIWFSICGH